MLFFSFFKFLCFTSFPKTGMSKAWKAFLCEKQLSKFFGTWQDLVIVLRNYSADDREESSSFIRSLIRCLNLLVVYGEFATVYSRRTIFRNGHGRFGNVPKLVVILGFTFPPAVHKFINTAERVATFSVI